MKWLIFVALLALLSPAARAQTPVESRVHAEALLGIMHEFRRSILAAHVMMREEEESLRRTLETGIQRRNDATMLELEAWERRMKHLDNAITAEQARKAAATAAAAQIAGKLDETLRRLKGAMPVAWTGSAEALSGQQLRVSGRDIHMAGVTDFARPPVLKLNELIRQEGGIVECQIANQVPVRFQCRLGKYNVAEYFLLNGLARAGVDASPRLLAAEQDARLSRRGCWRGGCQ